MNSNQLKETIMKFVFLIFACFSISFFNIEIIEI